LSISLLIFAANKFTILIRNGCRCIW